MAVKGRRRQVTITANIRPGYSQQVALDALRKEPAALRLDPAYSHGTTGSCWPYR